MLQRDLAQLARQVFDVLVIGGGIYGVFVAWDAARRGLSVALVEKADFGHATSSNTLRIIHGGFRYLQHGDVRRMRQSISERRTFMRLAPHLVHPLAFLIPIYGHGMRGKEMFTLALWLNDLVGYDRNRELDPRHHLPHGRVISRQACLRLAPDLEAVGLTGGAMIYDGQVTNSERLVLAVARSAAKAGAELANYVEVTGFLQEAARITGVAARDVLTGNRLDVRARMVVNTSGPWLEQVLGLLDSRRPKRPVRLSKAFNLLIDRQLIPRCAVGVYSKDRFNDRDARLNTGSRLFFITPWRGRSLIGTAHLSYDADPDNVRVTEAEIQAFLDQVNRAYPAARLRRQDVRWVYGGLLPISGVRAGEVQLITRHRIHDHAQAEGLHGLLSVVGVKFTEARHVAEKAVDLVFRRLGQAPPPSTMAITPVHGGQIESFDAFVTQETRRRPQGLSAEAIRDLIGRYGTEYSRVLHYLSVSPGQADGQGDSPAFQGLGTLVRAEVLHGMREEMAQQLTDVVFRRTVLGSHGHPGDACLRTCAAIMAQELGWDARRTEQEVQAVQAAFAEWA